MHYPVVAVKKKEGSMRVKIIYYCCLFLFQGTVKLKCCDSEVKVAVRNFDIRNSNIIFSLDT